MYQTMPRDPHCSSKSGIPTRRPSTPFCGACGSCSMWMQIQRPFSPISKRILSCALAFAAIQDSGCLAPGIRSKLPCGPLSVSRHRSPAPRRSSRDSRGDSERPWRMAPTRFVGRSLSPRHSPKPHSNTQVSPVAGRPPCGRWRPQWREVKWCSPVMSLPRPWSRGFAGLAESARGRLSM
jgi:hypothetical protein